MANAESPTAGSSGQVAPGFPARASQTANDQWNFFGKQTYDQKGRLLKAGHKEGETTGQNWAARVGEFWLEGCGIHGVDGTNHDHPWSAAFISWVMKTAGAGARFHYAPQHSVYVSQAIRDCLSARAEAGYWCHRLNEATPVVGDIVCWARQSGIDYDHQNGGDYAGHCDLVVSVSPATIEIIGGNVGDSVTRRPLPLTEGGFLPPYVENGETLFGLMKCRLG